MIMLEQYVGPHADSRDWTPDVRSNARSFLEKCAALEAEMVADGVEFHVNPATGSNVSGYWYGGFRPQDCPEGAPGSSHKVGRGVDRYDPDGDIDQWCMEHQDRLEAHGIYIEHPAATRGWSHWTDRAPKSGRRVFYP